MEEVLKQTIKELVVKGKGILAADESVSTATKRLNSINTESTDETRRQYRNMILAAPGMEKYIAGVILFEETLHQETDLGENFCKHLARKGIVSGIKVDLGLEKLNDNGEEFTKGLEDLDERLKEYRNYGARFTKWRAVYHITDTLPSEQAIRENAKGLAKYAKICHHNGFIPIVEPEVLIDGNHSIQRSYEVNLAVIKALFEELKNEEVKLEYIILKPSMVISGKDASNRASIQEVASLTLQCLKEAVPHNVASINFLSGGQTSKEAITHLNEMNKLDRNLPWYLSFSYARALQGPALNVWQGRQENLHKAQEKFVERARFCGLAALGEYDPNEDNEN